MMAQEEVRLSIIFSWVVADVLQFALYSTEVVTLEALSVVRVSYVPDKSW